MNKELNVTMVTLDQVRGVVYSDEGKPIISFVENWKAPEIFDSEIVLKGDWYFLDLGSTIAFGGDDPLIKVREVLYSIKAIAKQNWHWFTEDATVVEDGVILDNRKYLWISFDSADDAMLSKMTLLGLRNQKYAHHRRLPGSSE